MDGGIKKKLKLNPRINASPLSLITFGYGTALYISISSFVYVCMLVNLLHLHLFAQYTTLYDLTDDLLLCVIVSYIQAYTVSPC
jgi:hypothetical protein